MKYWSLTFLIFITLFLCSNVFAQTEPEIPQPIKIAVNKNSFPFHFQNQQGQPDGIMVDYWKLWAKKQNVEIEFVLMGWLETLASVSEGEMDIHAGLVKTDDRAKKFTFTPTFFNQKSNIYIHRNYNHIDNISQLMPFTIGVVEGSSHIEKLKEINPNFILREYKDRFALFDGALNGEVAAFSILDRIFRNYERRKELLTQFPTYRRLLLNKDEYVSALSIENKSLFNFVKQGMEKITSEERAVLEKKWLGFNKSSDKLLLAYTPNLLPYMGVSNTGEAQGLFVDIWRLWSKQSGLAVEFIPEKMSEAVELIKEGGIDAHIAFPNNQLSIDHLTLAQQVYEVPSNVYISNNIPNITELAQLEGKRLGIFISAPYIEQVQKNYPDLQLVFLKNYSEMLNAIKQDEIDAFVGAVETTREQLVQANLQSSFYSLATSPFRTKIFALTQKKNARLVEIIKEGFEILPPEEILKLEKHWLLNTDEGYYKVNAKKVQLTTDERAFRAKIKTAKVGINKSWPPVEFVDKNGDVKGINADILAIISQRTGVNFTFQTYDNWNDMFQGLLNKEVDILGSASASVERKKVLSFSVPYWDMPWVVIHQRQQKSGLKLKDFYGKKLAIVKGYQIAKVIQEEHPSILLTLVDDHEEGIQAVQQGSVQGLIENIASASELIRRESLMTLYMSVIDEFKIDENSFAIRKDWPELTSIFNKALMSISESERQTIYEKWFGINLETGFDKDTVLRLSAQIGVIIITVIVVIVVWNRRLYVEIQTRKSLEQKMKHMATHDELTGLANRVLLKDRINTAINFHQRQSLKMALLFIDLDGFKAINDTYGHDVGDELLKRVADRLSQCVRKSDTTVRFGGDEFVLLLTGLHNQNEAAFIAEKVLKLMQQPFQLSIAEAKIGCSIGIAMYPGDAKTETDLLKEADRLMYEVKASGKNHYVFSS
ncbi:transporter substrate-binding domain-containing protein [Colwellia sp. 1_MG-2023]|uniref:transporter substrate-binding domain-containing protein n=1 Tax=Colwellia sp. 1_MG-2023 TaxID=3062649 RepID=UPI0026E164E0|nr:transporter substrate-binding domain-containing protein [Colwellia sp. 1_MG-2023]MDO6445793.1 transporter substrate-binding domain-containing protein [Colwellia sp. 1_MG-2023]